ncbi:hypothetical protein SAMN04487948_105318 [Halogranum amylolyticum]|uniref:Proteasome lid subunit RPN8/RPN11, contains Jab1/MPN metalloenzyme (JAMM) motif n=1 Tax=Halogranum amylolyticum TaxID=660520 RepID=A0A1H8STN4_9EURY|nr:hypothetical protein SAMN04487948_105318 [Halogranum amylolyticum]
MVYVTRGLLDVLLDLAEDAEPKELDVTLSSTPAEKFDTDLGLDPETPVLTHFVLPEAGWPVSAVFGMDIGTPAGRGRARFVTHPQGRLEVTQRDHLAAVVLVAVPPWDERSYAAFDRSGRQLELVVLDVEPPQESLA